AIQAFKEALTLDPNRAETHYYLGEVYYDIGDDSVTGHGKLTVAELEAALKLAPKDETAFSIPEAYRLLGYAEDAVGNRHAACGAWQQYLDLSASTDQFRAEVSHLLASCL